MMGEEEEEEEKEDDGMEKIFQNGIDEIDFILLKFFLFFYFHFIISLLFCPFIPTEKRDST